MEFRRQSITPEISLLVDPASGTPKAVSSAFPRDTWKPRQSAAPGVLMHPGTALRIGEAWFEIVASGPDSARRGAILHTLSPWDASAVIRVADELTADSCRAAAKRYRESEQRRRRARGLGPLTLLTGLLPAEDQQHLEREYGVPGSRATTLSALVLLAVSVLGLMVGFAASQGHGFGAWTRLAQGLWDWVPLVLYMFVESITRFRQGLSSDEPVGSLPVAGPILIFRAFRDALRGVGSAPPKTSVHAFSKVRDTVRPWPGPDADLEILSRLPKDSWVVHASTINYQGKAYQLVDRQVLDEGVERYRFLLQVPEHDVLMRYTFEYEPEEVREIHRAQRRHQAQTWIETFALVWGWLDHDRQERLSRTYGYNPQRMTQRSILFNGVLGGLAAAQGFVRMRELGGLLNVMECFAGAVLLWESTVRWSHWRAGRWRSSLLGVLSRPAADRFLRWEKYE